MSRPGKDLSRQFLLRKARMRELEARTPPSISLLSNVKDVDNAIPLNDFPPVRTVRLDDGGSLMNVKNELLAILNELRFITHKIKVTRPHPRPPPTSSIPHHTPSTILNELRLITHKIKVIKVHSTTLHTPSLTPTSHTTPSHTHSQNQGNTNPHTEPFTHNPMSPILHPHITGCLILMLLEILLRYYTC